MNTRPFLSTVLSAPERTSRAFWGNFAQILPYSEMCRYCSVPERKDTPTRMLELLPSSNSHALSFSAGRACLRPSGRL
jgi:hypothetical protein